MDEQPELRRALLRGYRRPDVELALARATIARERVQLELEATRKRADDVEREVDDLRTQIVNHRQRETELLAALDEVRDRRESFEREARVRADEILNDARERAAGLRTEGLKEVGELQEHVEQLLGLRTGLTATLKRTMLEVGGVLERLAGNGKHEKKAEQPEAPAIEPSQPAEEQRFPEDLGAALLPFPLEPDDEF
jgi:cell division septum initiation protein DivIVA